jgi:outer membrane protein assembly factor BamB
MKKAGACLLTGILMTTTGFAEDWPQFCGPQRNNVSAETGLARNWPKDGPDVLWETAVSRGYAGPAIKGGKVYFLDREGENSLIRCLNLASGKEDWRCAFSDPGQLKAKQYEGTRGTPTVTDDSLYAVTFLGTAVCVDLKSHEVKWQCNFVEDYDKKLDGWGVAQSPLVYGDVVILAPMTKQHSLLALDQNSGKEVWTVSGFLSEGFSSPQILSVDGVDQVVMAAGIKAPKPVRRGKDEEAQPTATAAQPTVVYAVSPQDGKLLWSYEGGSGEKPIPHPIQVSRNSFFIRSCYKAVSAMLQVEKNEGGYAIKELWQTKEAATQIEQPVFFKDHLFVGGTFKSPRKGLICMDLDGNVKWDSSKTEGAPAFTDLNMIAADGMLIGLDGDSGVLHLIEASSEVFNELASAKVVAEKGQTWAPIALSDGKLIVRDHDVMKCLKLK